MADQQGIGGWPIPGDLAKLHDAITAYAVRIQAAAAKKQEKTAEGPVSHSALFTLHRIAIVTHRATRSLCEMGWTQVTPTLIRTLLDVLANSYAIISKPEVSEYMAFKYMCVDLIKVMKDLETAEEVRKHNQLQVEKNTTVSVGMYFNTPGNFFDHIAFGIGNGPRYGLNPKSDSQFQKYKLTHWRGGPGVPGAVTKQVGGTLDRTARVQVTGMQAQMIQNGINQGIQNPPNYDNCGGANSCDCASWPQQVLGDAGVNTGPPTQIPNQLMNQLDASSPQQQ